MKNIRKALTAVLCLTLPVPFIFWLLNAMGHRVHPQSKIGFSFIWINGRLILNRMSRIGHFNLIVNNSVAIEREGYIGNGNSLKGPFEILLDLKAAIGNGNRVYRAPLGVTYGEAHLKLGTMAKITARHNIDCTRTITIGAYSIVAGHDSQLWTHAYYHDNPGPSRFRVDGEIEIGENVNIGSRSILNCGIKIVDNVVVGSNSSVSKSLLHAGTYVSQPLRYFEPTPDARTRFKKINTPQLQEEVYERKS